MLSMSPMRHGPRDPTTRLAPGAVCRSFRTPSGAAAGRFSETSDGIRVEAWGDGASWIIENARDMVGAHDSGAGDPPAIPKLVPLSRKLRGLRFPKTRMVCDALIPAVLEQKVTSKEAFHSYRMLTERYSEPAPGPLSLTLPVDPQRIRKLPYYAFHQLGVERKRAETLLRVAECSDRLEETVSMPLALAYRRLLSIAGVGRWTAAETARIAFGDTDAVSVGDYHLPHLVSWALTGKRRGSDELMIELLEPCRPERARAVRLIELGVPKPQRRAPRAPRRDLRAI